MQVSFVYLDRSGLGAGRTRKPPSLDDPQEHGCQFDVDLVHPQLVSAGQLKVQSHEVQHFIVPL